MNFLDELNDRQKEAATALKGPLLIIAGAGSGKTRTLTYRIANVIGQGMAQPWQILAVTFTNKAAEEMKKRIQKLLQDQFQFSEDQQPTIGTFHSVCVRILRRHLELLGREKSFTIYDTGDTLALMKRLFKEHQIDDEKLKPQGVLGMISKSKNNLEEPEAFTARASSYFEKTVAKLYKAYQEELKKNNAMDFDDLLCYTVRLFRKHPEVLDQYQERWRYINVDEYQDTNHVQYTLTNLLAQKYRNLCVIGDSDQSIYSFRGADIKNILEFEKDYPDAKIVKLEENYRSTKTILSAANAIIEKNKARKKKEMFTKKEGGDLVEVWHLGSEYEEVDFVSREIERLRKEEVSLRDIVILYRTNAQSRLMEEALLRYGFPYRVLGGVKFYARAEVKDLLAYLRLILNRNDTDSLLRVINVPSRKIGDTTLHRLQSFALSRTLTLGEVLKHIEMISDLNAGTKASLEKFYQILVDLEQLSHTLTVSELIKELIRKTGYKEYLLDGTEEGEMRYQNVLELISVATKYDGLEPLISLMSFLEEVALVQDTDSLMNQTEVLTLMTLHSVKGLEYPYVFIVGCEENIFPHSQALFDETQMEEERRLMYVGVTRAMHKLYLLAAKKRMLYGDFQANPISRFIYDIPDHLVSKNLVEERVSKGRTSFYEPPMAEKTPSRTAESQFKDGDRVRHAVFGDGMVIERRGDLVTIAFENKQVGLKKFAANIAPLQKL